MALRPDVEPRVSWILLTMGNRPSELAAALESIRSSAGDVSTEIVVVANGATAPVEVPADVELVTLDENRGVPGGRNAGAARATGEILAFLDDDAEIVTPDLADRLVSAFEADPALAVVSMRITDPEQGRTARRHVPRIGGDPLESGPVTAFLGGASAVRADAFRSVGGLPDDFFYALEETDLGWRLLDAGWNLRYDADMVVEHPWTVIERHDFAERLTARNRVLVARRRLPWLLAPVYVLVWAAITAVRTRRMGSWWQGTREGMAMAVERRPMRWRTVLRMTRLGRPPVI